MNVLALNLVLNTLIFWIIARVYLLPRLQALSLKAGIIIPILLLHSMRHLGLMFLAPGATYPGIPPEFAYPAAYGDVVAAALALGSLSLLIRNHRSAVSLIWGFNLWGTLDLVVAIVLATIFQADAYMGPSYWIPAFWVPALLVTHYIVFVALRKRSPSPSSDNSWSRGRI